MEYNTQRDFYEQLLNLIESLGTGANFVLDAPQFELLVENNKIKESTRIRRIELIGQIVAIQNEYFCRSVLSTFFFNIFEYLLSPVRLLLILIQIFLLRCPLNLSRSERQAFEKSRKQRMQL